MQDIKTRKLEAIYGLIAPYLELSLLVSVGNRATIVREAARRICYSEPERRQVLDSRQLSDFPRNVRVLAISPTSTLLDAVASSKLMDTRMKACICTYVELGDSELKWAFDWYVETLIFGQIVARPLTVSCFTSDGPIRQLDDHHFAVVEKSGSFRLYNRYSNRVIGGFDRCSRHVIAFVDTVVLAESLARNLLTNA